MDRRSLHFGQCAVLTMLVVDVRELAELRNAALLSTLDSLQIHVYIKSTLLAQCISPDCVNKPRHQRHH